MLDLLLYCEEGKFESPILVTTGFFTMLGTLVGELEFQDQLAATKSGLTIAIQYSDKRKTICWRRKEVSIELPRTNEDFFRYPYKTYAIHFALQ
jgi:acyl-CoA oxidase